MSLLPTHGCVVVSLPASIPRRHPYIPPSIASAHRRIFILLNTTMSRVKVTTRHIQWWSTVYGKGSNIHDRSKSSSLIDMAKWSVGPSGRWEDDNNPKCIQAKSQCMWLQVFDRKDTDGIWSIHLSGIFGEEGRFQLAEVCYRGIWSIHLSGPSGKDFMFIFFYMESGGEVRVKVFADKPRIHGLRESAVGKTSLECWGVVARA